MPWAPRRPCLHPGCRELIPAGTSRCPEHERQERRMRETGRPSAAARGYGTAWRKLRAAILERDDYACTTPGCGAPATEVDHIIPRHQGGSDEHENLRSLCAAHHGTKTGLERHRLRFGPPG